MNDCQWSYVETLSAQCRWLIEATQSVIVKCYQLQVYCHQSHQCENCFCTARMLLSFTSVAVRVEQMYSHLVSIFYRPLPVFSKLTWIKVNKALLFLLSFSCRENNTVYSRLFQIFATRCLFSWNAASERPKSRARGISGALPLLRSAMRQMSWRQKRGTPPTEKTKLRWLIQFSHNMRIFPIQLFNFYPRQLR